MKKLISFWFIIILFFYETSYSQSTGKLKMPVYPIYADVVAQFLNNYLPDNIENQTMFDMIKKPDGWHARTVNYLDNKPIKDELFWSRKGKKYLDLTYSVNTSGQIDPANEHLKTNYAAILFSAYVPYWGYEGWDKDVIDEFGDKNNLSDSLQNALARAYSSYAGSILRPQVYYNSKIDSMPKGQNALTPEVLNKYLKYEHLAIENYYNLYQMNPGFETFVSNSFNVYSSEILNCFLTLRYYQNEETAKKELKTGLYDSFYIEMAKNYLNSCDSNAILFTNGDMDTYPLLYVQENENFRKDVLVTNVSLLNLGRYANHLANFKAGARPLKLSLDTSIYRSETKPYVYVLEKTDQAVALDEIIKLVASDDKETKIETADNQLIDYLPSRNIYFKIDNEKFRNQYKSELNSTDSSIDIHIDKNYLTIAEFCILDIISSNLFERPVYFASTIDKNSIPDFGHYMQCQGIANKLVPFYTGEIDEYNLGTINTEVQVKKLFENLKFESANHKPLNLCTDQKKIVNMYRNIYGRLAEQLIDEEKKDKALKVLDKCYTSLPSDKIPYNYFAINVIKSYFALGEKTKAIYLATSYLNILELELKANTIKVKNGDTNIDANKNNFELNSLYDITNEYIPHDGFNKKVKTALVNSTKNLK